MSNSSSYIEEQRRNYSLYVLQHRAIVSIADGLKAGARRVLWVGRDGHKHKSASLAGLAMPLHPHAAPESTIDTLAMPYGNNIPLLTGSGTFGTRLKPTACGASRYTSVKISDFTEQVVFVDRELIPMKPNYDNTMQEPVHLLPLVPICLLNPSEGIAVGFASNILSRDLEDIINNQIQHLQGKKIKEPSVYCKPLNQYGIRDEEKLNRWTFRGEMEIKNTTTVVIRDLGYGVSHESFTRNLLKLLDNGVIVDYTDDSRNTIDVEVKFERKTLSGYSEPELRNLLKVDNSTNENMVLIDFNGQTVLTTDYLTVIKTFTDWRLTFYKQRYQLLKEQLDVQIQRYKDVICAINNDVGSKARKVASRKELITYLGTLSIVYTDYISDLPVYRFTEEEKAKVQAKLDEALKTAKLYDELIKSDDKRKEVYIDELKTVLKRFK